MKNYALKLLPCPFCGSYPEFEHWHGGSPTKITIECYSEKCEVMPSVCGETPEEAASYWNARSKRMGTKLVKMLEG